MTLSITTEREFLAKKKKKMRFWKIVFISYEEVIILDSETLLLSKMYKIPFHVSIIYHFNYFHQRLVLELNLVLLKAEKKYFFMEMDAFKGRKGIKKQVCYEKPKHCCIKF